MLILVWFWLYCLVSCSFLIVLSMWLVLMLVMVVIESIYIVVKKFCIGFFYNVLIFVCFYVFNKEVKIKMVE